MNRAIYGFPLYFDGSWRQRNGFVIFSNESYVLLVGLHRKNENRNMENLVVGTLRQDIKWLIWSLILMVRIYWNIADNTLFSFSFYILVPNKDCRNFADDVPKFITWMKIAVYKISLKFVPRISTDKSTS